MSETADQFKRWSAGGYNLAGATIPKSTSKYRVSSGVPSLNLSGGESLDAIPNIDLTSAIKANPNSLLNSVDAESVTPGFNTDSLFDMKGTGGFALGALNTGISGFGTWMNAKNQKFMQGYYGDQMAMQKLDFGNNARASNASLQDGQQNALNARGIDFTQGAGKEQLDAYMSKWGAKESIG